MCCGIEGLCTALTGGGVRGAMRRYIMVSDWEVWIGKGICRNWDCRSGKRLECLILEKVGWCRELGRCPAAGSIFAGGFPGLGGRVFRA